MTYVISDLHGYPIEKLKKLLETANFGEDDFLYILGDVIDRNGDGGLGVLQWLLYQPNVELIMGNHEAMLLSCDFVFDEITDTLLEHLDEKQYKILQNYILNGGGVTLRNLAKLDIHARYDIVDYLRDCPLYEALTVGDRDYVLVHAGFENFGPDRKISDYSPDELFWAEPELDDEYYDDIHTIFGHTPTSLFGEEYKGKIVRTRTWTCIDCGAAMGLEPVLLRLDDNKEFRLS
jgi:serine/threonine protein phosphatase 1